MSYAERTSVSVDRSRGELLKVLEKYGATDFMAGEVAGKAQVIFRCQDRRIRFQVPMTFEASGMSEARFRAWKDQETRRLWRALVLSIKARLEAVSSGIETFDEAFLAHVVVQGGKTFGEMAIPAIDSGGTKAVAGLLGSGS